ncbi:MAG: hypothetical protein GDA49_02010 [Rhodospirillales bacterium]|nr:hypothetical protein [Rhodospirillales bacterium]
MRLARMGSFHQCRLSFMRTLLRRLRDEAWTFNRPRFAIDDKGVGVAVYTAAGPENAYSLVAFAHDLPDDLRSDRVIAEAWDATFALFDGVPTDDDIERLSRNVPIQEAGRYSERELSVSRANRSVRLFDHVIESLAAGRQPDADRINAVGYLMRTTAVYGSGKFGAADRELICTRPEFAGPFQAEMLSVWLIRAFTLDLVEHLARTRSPETAVAMDPAVRRRFGVGNSTGLGMAPFLITHPALLNNWIAARETALARVRSVERASELEIAVFRTVLERACLNADLWPREHPLQAEKLDALYADLAKLSEHVRGQSFAEDRPWDRLYLWAEASLSLEGQEQLVSLLLEPYGDLVDDLTPTMSADELTAFRIDGGQPLRTLSTLVDRHYGWALDVDWGAAASRARVWYVSEEKLEPRLGERFEEPIEPYEQPLAPGRDVAALRQAIDTWEDECRVADFLLAHPRHRYAVRRVQAMARFPYAEVRDNTIASDLLPIDMLRCKLSFFGASHFDPKSDRWVRINMYRGAPFPHELADAPRDDWSYPVLP